MAITEQHPDRVSRDGAGENMQNDGAQVEDEIQQQAKERTAISAHVVHEAIATEGNEELRRPSSALFWSGLAAGLSIGFSMVTEALLTSALPDTPWRPLIAKLGYSVGFLIVILGRQQLFTENTLTPVLPLLNQRTMSALRNMLRLWGIVLVANMIGAFIFAFVAAYSGVFDAALQSTFKEMGLHAMDHNFWAVLVRGIFAGWLIALLVWVLPYAEASRVIVIIIMTWVIGIGGFAHIVAGSVEDFYVGITGAADWGQVLMQFWLPALLGNIVGGISLVAALNHAQVVAGGRQEN